MPHRPLSGSRGDPGALARTEHHHRAKRCLSLADQILIASTATDDTIHTADPDVLAIAVSKGIPTIELPGDA